MHALVRARRNEHEQSWAGGAADAFDDLVEVPLHSSLPFLVPPPSLFYCRPGTKPARISQLQWNDREDPWAGDAFDDPVEVTVD